jgi:hypothetical protein
VDHVTRFRIVDPLQFHKRVREVEVGKNRQRAIVYSALRDELALQTIPRTKNLGLEPD